MYLYDAISAILLLKISKDVPNVVVVSGRPTCGQEVGKVN